MENSLTPMMQNFDQKNDVASPGEMMVKQNPAPDQKAAPSAENVKPSPYASEGKTLLDLARELYAGHRKGIPPSM